MIRRYVRDVMASDPITVDNAREVAVWCGGVAMFTPKPSDPTDVHVKVRFPSWSDDEQLTLTDALVGDRIVETEQGRFFKARDAEFTSHWRLLP